MSRKRMLIPSPFLANEHAIRKMATSKHKAFCVPQFAKTESAVTVQRAFSIKLGCQSPNDNNNLRWYHQFETTGCLCKGKKEVSLVTAPVQVQSISPLSSSGRVARFLGGQTGGCAGSEIARVGVESTKKPTPDVVVVFDVTLQLSPSLMELFR
ncbi:DUF4817 domain-containing protein [Trichonephila clavipes]|nr:DUF4817 domain-containing protein [Trichonephila clavipes]